jgi:hypothetical protein
MKLVAAPLHMDESISKINTALPVPVKFRGPSLDILPDRQPKTHFGLHTNLGVPITQERTLSCRPTMACAAGRYRLKRRFSPAECLKIATFTLVRQHGQHLLSCIISCLLRHCKKSCPMDREIRLGLGHKKREHQLASWHHWHACAA